MAFIRTNKPNGKEITSLTNLGLSTAHTLMNLNANIGDLILLEGEGDGSETTAIDTSTGLQLLDFANMSYISSTPHIVNELFVVTAANPTVTPSGRVLVMKLS